MENSEARIKYIHKCVQLWYCCDEGDEGDEGYEATPLDFEKMPVSRKNLSRLLDSGVSPDSYLKRMVPIHSSAEYFNLEPLQLLIDYGADPKLRVQPMTEEEIEQDIKDEPCEYRSNRRWHQINEGNNALHLIVRDCKEERLDDNKYGHACMKAILDKDPSVIHIKNAHGLTPWDMVKDSEAPNTKMKSIMEGYM